MDDSEASGQQGRVEIDAKQKTQIIEMANASPVVKDQKGAVKVTQTLEMIHTISVAIWGGFCGLLIGLLF